MSPISRLQLIGRIVVVMTVMLPAEISRVPAQVTRLGSYSPSSTVEAIRHTEAVNPLTIFLLDENFRFGSGASNAAFGPERAYVIDGQYLREFKSSDFVSGPTKSYNAGTALLDVALGSTGGEVLLLTRAALRIVDMNASPAPKVLASVSVTNSQPTWGKLLAKFGDTVYVADNSIRGFRVFDAHKSMAPAELTRYTSNAKVTGKPTSFTVTDLRREGSNISLVIGNTLDVVSVDNPLSPSRFTSQGLIRFAGVNFGLLNSGYAFLTEDLSVHIVDVRPGSPTFMTELLRFAPSAAITDLFAYKGRLYVLCGKLGYEVWDISAYSPK